MLTRWLMVLLIGCVMTVAATAQARQTISGSIESTATGSITVKATDGETQTYKVDSSARITLDGKRATLEDLKTGDSVMVTIEKKNGDMTALSITARTKA